MAEIRGESPRLWLDGTVRLPDAIESWLDGHFDGEKGDDAEELTAARNIVAVALWSLIYRQGDPDEDQAVLDALVRAPHGYSLRATASELEMAERAFLDASIAVWRQIDRLSAQGEYPGIEQGTTLRVTERAAWERYRDLLDANGTYPANETMPIDERIALWLRAIQDDLTWMGAVVAGRGWPSPAEQVQILSTHAIKNLHWLAIDIGVELGDSMYDFDSAKGYERLVSFGWTPPGHINGPMAERIDAVQFEQEYAERSGWTVEALREHRKVVPCDCDFSGCEGWGMVSLDGDHCGECGHYDFKHPIDGCAGFTRDRRWPRDISRAD